MEWVLISPQIHSTFGSLGFFEGEVYHVNDDCLTILEEIYSKLQNEDRNLRTFRRAVGFGQNIKKDLVPLLVHVRDNPKITDLTVKILVNLTIPVECLLCIDSMSKNNTGRQTIFELNNLLVSSKEAFIDSRVTKSVLDYTNQILENNRKMSAPHLENVNNSLLLLRNILHIPEIKKITAPNPLQTSPQNQIIWNLFTQSIDKTLLHLISSTNGAYWCVTIVQIIALIYKDQHIGTLQKLLNLWFEASLSESSEDNESNTSPPEQGSEDSSPLLTSDPTSDSSDNGGKGKCNNNNNNNRTKTTPSENVSHQEKPKSNNVGNNNVNANKDSGSQSNKNSQGKNHNISSNVEESENTKLISDTKNPEMITSNSAIISNRLNGKRGPTTPLSNLILDLRTGLQSSNPVRKPKDYMYFEKYTCSEPNTGSKRECVSTNSEFSDCGYVTQIEGRESISTSSNEEEEAQRKHFHQKSHSQKQRMNIKKRPLISVQERKEKRRKKLVERGRTSIINLKGLVHHIPTDEDITNVIKEFTVDFILKGYGHLIHNLHSQLIYNIHLQIDTSHFFWILTYFLKFAAQLELDLEYVKSVLSFDILSYLVYEGVNLCEQIQLLSKVNNSDLKCCLRRIHLVITAIREFIQTIDIYKKIAHLSDEDRVQLVKLQIRISSTEDLRCLFVLLLRHYQPDVYNKQYLQDLIVTNHILLIFLDNAVNRPDSEPNFLIDHLRQFATVEVMHQYGLLLQDFKTNGEYVNDCIFTMMHHVGGDLGCTNILFQPNILKVFLAMWESGFQICEDWNDLVDYVINTFMRNPRSAPKRNDEESETNDFEDSKSQQDISASEKDDDWTEEELDNLQWNYMQSIKNPNMIENICNLYREEGANKSHNSVVRQLFRQGVISDDEYQRLLICSGSKRELQEYFNCSLPSQVPNTKDEVEILKTELEKQNMTKALIWIQKILLEVCFIKICFQNSNPSTPLDMNQIIPTMEPICFHNIIMNQPVPIVPWNNEQSTAIHNQTFLILLHRLGFQLPVDSGKLFIRIPNFWDPDMLLVTACRLGPIDESNLKFSIKEMFTNSKSEKKNSNKSSRNQHKDKDGNGVFRIKQIKKISSVVQVTELASDSIVIKETKISTIEEKTSSWLDIIMNNKSRNRGTKMPNLNSEDMKMPNLSSEDIKMDHENSMGPPIFSSHFINIINEPSQIIIPPSEDSVCETASVTSDLTRMYVSDEEEKNDPLII